MALALVGRFASYHRFFPSTRGFPSTTRPFRIYFKCFQQSRSVLALRSRQPNKKASDVSTRGFFVRYEPEGY